MAAIRKTHWVGRICSLLALLWSTEIAHAEQGNDGREPLVVAASRDHLWFVQSSGKSSPAWELCHHAAAMHGPHFRAQLPLDEVPAGMAAWEDTLWLVFENAAAQQRDVYSVRVQRLSNSEPYFQTMPVERMELAAALPLGGYFCGMAGAAEGPVVLLGAVSESLPTPRLLQLRAGAWADIPLSDGAMYSPDAEILTVGHRGEEIAIVSRSVSRQSAVMVDRRTTDGVWQRQVLGGLNGRVVGAVGFLDQVFVLTSLGGAKGWEITVARPQGALHLGSVNSLGGSSVVFAFNGEVWILNRQRSQMISLRRLLLPEAELSAEERLVVQPPGSRSIWAMAIVFAAVVGGVLVILVLRPGSRQPVALEKGWRPLSLGSRLLALVFDALPAGLATTVVLDVKPAELARVPLLTPDFADCWPYLVMVIITVGHSLVSELVFGRSLGLMLIGGCVRAGGGATAGPGQILLRSAVKFLILVVPPLAVFALVTPNLQGLHDSLSRTVVVQPDEDGVKVRKNRGGTGGN